VLHEHRPLGRQFLCFPTTEPTKPQRTLRAPQETEGNVAAGTFEGGAGAVLAGKTPLGRLGRVTDIAPLAVFLASDESAWITGEVIGAAGGLVVAT
jgi:NAD(P)-dependent dehydrogenase (short-subunit alcohol dehydrogenase family)